MFSAQPTRVRELRTQHVRSLNMALEAWGAEIVASMQRIYQKMMAENIMKSGREGLLEEMGKTRESILNQLSHPDSGLRSDTLLVFLCQHLTSLGQRWAELERNLAQEARRESNAATDVMVDQLFLQAAQAASILNTLDMLALAPRNLEARALEALQNVFVALQQLRSSFSTIIMPEGLKSFLQEEASVLEVGQRVEAIVGTCSASLEEVRHETMLHTRCVMLGMDSPHQATIETVLEMRRLFQEQVDSLELKLQLVNFENQVAIASSAEAMSTGQMLLCAANTLFDKVTLILHNSSSKTAMFILRITYILNSSSKTASLKTN